MYDTHTHSHFSYDGSLDVEQMILNAIAAKADYLAISDHCDKDFLFVPEFANIRQLDLDTRWATLNHLKQKYADKIYLAIGIECGYMTQADQMYKQILQDYNTDIIINSVHLIEGEDCYFRTFFDKRTKQQAYGSYLKAIRASLDCDYPYDVLAHLGYVTRKSIYSDKLMRYDHFADMIDDILKVIIAKNKALEINTHTSGLGEDFLPTKDILIRYKQLGGQLLTFGSDAHQMNRMFDKYDIVCQQIKSIGFKYLFKYVNHNPIAVQI